MLRSAVQFPAKSSRSSVFRCCPTARDRPANGSPAFKLFTRGSLAELLIVYWRNVEWKLITKIYSLSSVSHYSWLPLLNLIISSTFKGINKANSSAANKASLLAARCSLIPFAAAAASLGCSMTHANYGYAFFMMFSIFILLTSLTFAWGNL